MTSLRKALAAGMLSLLLAASALLLAGCASGPTDEEAVRQAVATELDKVKNLDDAALNEVMGSLETEELSALGIDGLEFVKEYLDGFDYTIEGIEVSGNEATARITVTAKSYQSYLTQIQQGTADLMGTPGILTMTQDELNAAIGDMMMTALSNTPATTSDPVEVHYVKSGNTWTADAGTYAGISQALMAA